MYTAPEVHELGAVSAFTLGSSRGIPSTQKANNNSVDAYDAAGDASQYGYGSPCTTQLPGTTLNCSTP